MMQAAQSAPVGRVGDNYVTVVWAKGWHPHLLLGYGCPADARKHESEPPPGSRVATGL
jgi:hypothetical protein